MTCNWDFIQELLEQKLSRTNFAVLVLNQPILCDEELIKLLWSKGVVRGLVDGGSNRWLDFITRTKSCDLKLPNFLSGDFDSVKPETKAYFAERGVDVIFTLDQNETDFTKALRQVGNYVQKNQLNIEVVLAICENSGRFDQVISNINTLHLSHNILKGVSVILVSSESITWLLPPGKHCITVTEDFIKKQHPCGLIPFCGPTIVSTSGLKWNLDKQTMEFGSLVSTSNTYSGKKVFIECNKSLIWTTQYL